MYIPSRMLVCIDDLATFHDFKDELGWVARHWRCGLVLFHHRPVVWSELGPVPADLSEIQRSFDAIIADPALVNIEVKTYVAESSLPLVDAVFEAATNEGADLLVVPTHGRSGVDRLIFGSVAERVIRSCRMPTLTFDLAKVPENRNEAAFDRIVVPVDFSLAAERVIPVAVRMAELSRCGVTLVHVIEDYWVAAYSSGGTETAVLKDPEIKGKVEAHLTRLVAEHSKSSTIPMEWRTYVGKLVERIHESVSPYRNPLLCVATQGRDSLGDHLLGSRAERILRTAHCSVLALPKISLG